MRTRILGWTVIGGLCLAAAVAILALLTGEIDDTDAKVIATSVAFSAFSATGSAGARLAEIRPRLRAIGAAGVAASAIAFLLLAVAVWAEGGDALWRAWGIGAVLALALSQAALVLAAARAGERPSVGAVTSVSVAVSALAAALAILPLAALVEESDALWRWLAVLGVLIVLTTALPPLERRLRGTRQEDGLANELEALADRLEARAPAEAAELRRLARRSGR
jgi:MFS family permease